MPAQVATITRPYAAKAILTPQFPLLQAGQASARLIPLATNTDGCEDNSATGAIATRAQSGPALWFAFDHAIAGIKRTRLKSASEA
jgi:hypothetical protein